MTGRQQYRVSWRRRDWASTTWNKSRTFPNEPGALRFVDQLESAWGDTSPAENITVDVRDVTPWRPHKGECQTCGAEIRDGKCWGCGR